MTSMYIPLVVFVCTLLISTNDCRPEAAIGGGFPSDNPWYRGDSTGNVIGPEGGGFTSDIRKSAASQSRGKEAVTRFRANNFNGPDMYGYDYAIPGANVYYVLFRNGGKGIAKNSSK